MPRRSGERLRAAEESVKFKPVGDGRDPCEWCHIQALALERGRPACARVAGRPSSRDLASMGRVRMEELDFRDGAACATGQPRVDRLLTYSQHGAGFLLHIWC